MTRTLFASGFAAFFALLLGACQSGATASHEESGRVTVVFEHPENFTDFKDSLSGTPRGREDFQYILGKTVREEASRKLKEGERLLVTFTDVDLAGDLFAPESMGGRVRVIKQLYPPRVTLHFKLTDAHGAVLKEGDRRLMDASFMQTTSAADRDGDLAYDRKLLRDWIKAEFR